MCPGTIEGWLTSKELSFLSFKENVFQKVRYSIYLHILIPEPVGQKNLPPMIWRIVKLPIITSPFANFATEFILKFSIYYSNC